MARSCAVSAACPWARRQLPCSLFTTLAHTLAAGKLTGQSSSGKSFSTIPSKFETTLFTGNKERDGFGSRAHRFIDVEVNEGHSSAATVLCSSPAPAVTPLTPSLAQNDLPGPGTYNEHEQKLLDCKVYSKKGLGGGFVSRTKRESGFKPSSSAPGPGNYERGGSFYDAILEQNRGNRSGSTSTFKPPTQRSVMVAADPLPGPTDYNVPRSFDDEEVRPPRRFESPAALARRVLIPPRASRLSAGVGRPGVPANGGVRLSILHAARRPGGQDPRFHLACARAVQPAKAGHAERRNNAHGRLPLECAHRRAQHP